MQVLTWQGPRKQFCEFFVMCIKCEVQKWKMRGFVYDSVLETVLPLHKESFNFPFKCACNIMNYTRLDIWSIGQTLQKIQTGLFNIWTILTGWYLLKLCQVRQCEFSPAMCMKCEAFYRKPHIVSKTHNESSNGSTESICSGPCKLEFSFQNGTTTVAISTMCKIKNILKVPLRKIFFP